MTSTVRRNSLKNVPLWQQHNPHVGLWFDKFLQKQKSDTEKMEPYVEHIRQVGSIPEPPEYKAFFMRWQAELKKMGAVLREAHTIGRLAAGLGNESVIENGLTLHHTYGVPYIPGSSLKGTARSYAAQSLKGAWAKKGNAFDTLFGRQDRVGIAAFYDALPIPGSWTIHNEIMTVHHPKYYQDQGEAPADWDSPTPIPFVAVSGTFLIALHAPQYPEWADSGISILQRGLIEKGVGGKTSSGFGRFDVKEIPLLPEEQAVQNFYQQLKALPMNQVANRLNSFIARWRSLEIAPAYKQEVAQAILNKVGKANRIEQSRIKIGIKHWKHVCRHKTAQANEKDAMKTIISLIGEQNVPNLLPILYLKPEQVVLVYSELTKQTAVRLTGLIENKTKVIPLCVKPYDIAQTKDAILQAVQSFSNDLSINFTGGTKPMSLAAYQAAVDLNAPLLYLQSEGSKTILYFYKPENGRYLHQKTEEIPPVITITDYLSTHLDDYQIVGIVKSNSKGQQFEQAVYDVLQPPVVDEICAGVKRLNTIDIDFVVRCGNIVGIIETKTGLKSPKAGIDQLNTAGGRAYLGTYTRKFFVCDQTWGKNLQDLKQIAIERNITIIELPSFGQNVQLSQDDIGKLQTTVQRKLGAV